MRLSGSHDVQSTVPEAVCAEDKELTAKPLAPEADIC